MRTRAGAALRILVADDHPVNQRLVLLQLAQLGHHADLVSNGAEAVTAVRRAALRRRAHDVRMPELDGPAATRLIRAELGGPRTVDHRRDRRRAPRHPGRVHGRRHGDFLTKPLVAADLARALARVTVGGVLDPDALDTLQDLVGGDPAALSDLVAEFLTETPPLVQALQTAVEDGDPAGALHAAHMLKGLSATFGATAMARLCQRVESHSAEPSPGMSSPLVAEIAAEHERVTVALRQLV